MLNAKYAHYKLYLVQLAELKEREADILKFQ
jgi:hypothetical protein